MLLTCQERSSSKRKLYGYPVNSGYMGLVGDSYILFATEGDYIEYMEG